MFAVVHLVGVGGFFACGEDGEFGHGADAHEGRVAEFADDRGQEAELPWHITGQVKTDAPDPITEEERDGGIGDFAAGYVVAVGGKAAFIKAATGRQHDFGGVAAIVVPPAISA